MILTAVLAAAATAIAPAPATTTAAAPRAVPLPPIIQRPIPFGARRRSETAAYSRRHYGDNTWRLLHPHVIVEHVSETSTAQAVFSTFAPDRPDPELHELPGICAHFVVDRDGRILQFVSTALRCRHAVGLNWTAIGIEHVGFADGDVLGDRRQLAASLRLTRWLRCRYGIPVRDVIGHNESLTSPYHHERVARLRGQTHSDMRRATMKRYRSALTRLGRCPS